MQKKLTLEEVQEFISHIYSARIIRATRIYGTSFHAYISHENIVSNRQELWYVNSEDAIWTVQSKSGEVYISDQTERKYAYDYLNDKRMWGDIKIQVDIYKNLILDFISKDMLIKIANATETLDKFPEINYKTIIWILQRPDHSSIALFNDGEIYFFEAADNAYEYIV